MFGVQGVRVICGCRGRFRINKIQSFHGVVMRRTCSFYIATYCYTICARIAHAGRYRRKIYVQYSWDKKTAPEIRT